MLLKQVEKTHGKGRNCVKGGYGWGNLDHPGHFQDEFKARIDPKSGQDRRGVLLDGFEKTY